MHSISTVAAREKLRPRHEPYFQKLGSSRHLGYQKLTASSSGSWIARFWRAEDRRMAKRSLGTFEELPPSQRFDAAKRSAEDWFEHLAGGGKVTATTIEKACRDYVQHLRDSKREAAAADADGRFKRWVYGSAFGATDLTKARRPTFTAWRVALTRTPAKVSRDKRTVPLTRERAPGTVNRDLTAVRAAMNYAKDGAVVMSDIPWSVALRPIENADGRRDVYLDRVQRRALLEQAPADLSTFLRALSLVPLRPGALAALNVASFDNRLGVLSIGQDKSGGDRKVKLPAATGAVFEAAASTRPANAPLFVRADGARWCKDAWKKPVKTAVLAAKLPLNVTAYALRHSTITDLVAGGLNILTVAQISGTSVAMIEKNYGHLRPEHATEALASLAL